MRQLSRLLGTVFFVARCSDFALANPPPVELELDVLDGERYARGRSLDDNPERGAV